jgi:clan AA aspartic protease (TIGR02281 family)
MKHILLCLIIVGMVVTESAADTVTLKNKNAINGVIVEESETAVVLNIGCGTITLQRVDIESIEHSGETTNTVLKKEWRKRYFESFPAPTDKEQELLDEFRALMSERGQMMRSAMQKDTMMREVSSLQRQIARLQSDLDALGAQLQSADPKKDTVRYNTLVVEFNARSNTLRQTADAFNALQKRYKEFTENETSYINHYLRFKGFFEKTLKGFRPREMSAAQREFYENLRERLGALQDDIKREEVAFTKQLDNIIVTAQLNNKVNASMLVDTGAGVTVISDSLAKKLGIDREELKQTIELSVAGGHRLSAKFILLDSVKIGDIEAKKVEAAIIEGTPSKGVDGLLGMNFLKHFSFRIDTEAQKIILNYFD